MLTHGVAILLLARGALAAPLPDELAPCFETPARFVDQLGDYRSPLLFADGTQVKSAADWAKRRAEILARWHEAMGSWPPLLKKPAITVLAKSIRENFTQCRVEVQIAKDQTIAGYLLIPDGAARSPAVLVPYYDAESSVGLLPSGVDFAYQLARRGFVTLAIRSPGGEARRPNLGAARCQPLSYLAYVAANCAGAIATLPEVDATRIGVVGHSYGGKWAMFAACLSDRFACGAWSDPGITFDDNRPNINYWEPWYLGATSTAQVADGTTDATNSPTTAYRELIALGMNLHELQTLMAPRPFFVSGGAEDPVERWTVLNHSLAVNQLLKQTQRVGMSNRPRHEPTPESNELIYQFFEHFLEPKQ